MAGRNPIGKKAMTPAERQARRRKKIAKADSAAVAKMKHAQSRTKAAKTFEAMPPGINVWRRIKVMGADGEPMEIWSAKQRPLTSMRVGDLQDEDLMSLTRSLLAEMNRRSLDLNEVPPSIMGARKLLADDLGPNESMTIGPLDLGLAVPSGGSN